MTASKKKRHVARSPEDLAAKKNLILDAAMSLLTEKGYTKTTISNVAERAGIGRGTVYWHYESKDDLFFALFTREIETLETSMEPLLQRDGPALQTIDALVHLAFAYYAESGRLVQAVLSVLGGADEAFQQRLVTLTKDLYSRYDQILAGLLERAKDEGDVRPDLDSEITAAAILSIFDAMYLHVAFGVIPNDPDRLTAAVVDLIHHGATPAGGHHA